MTTKDERIFRNVPGALYTWVERRGEDEFTQYLNTCRLTDKEG